jgi:hypothetical protein
MEYRPQRAGGSGSTRYVVPGSKERRERASSPASEGRLATVDWIELMVTLTENESWYVRESGLSVHHRCWRNLSASSIDAAMLIRLTLPPAKTEFRIGNRSSKTTWRAGLQTHERLLSTSVLSHPRPGAGRERMRQKHDLQDERSSELLKLAVPLARLEDRPKGRRAL